MKITKYVLLIILLSIIIVSRSFAQLPSNNKGTSSSDEKEPLEGVHNHINADTLLTFYYYANNPKREYATVDTALTKDFLEFDPAYKGDWAWQTLGYMGSAARPLLWQSYNKRGFQFGYNQFDLYNKDPETVRFYTLKKAFTNISYSQSQQDDARFKAQFSRNFNNGLNFSLDFQRINQTRLYTYNYQNQKAKVSNLAVGVAYRPIAKRYSFYLSYVVNNNSQQDNGGISDATLFTSKEFWWCIQNSSISKQYNGSNDSAREPRNKFYSILST